MTLSEYIAAANSVLSPPLSGPELRWAADAMAGGVPPKRWAGWLALTGAKANEEPIPSTKEN